MSGRNAWRTLPFSGAPDKSYPRIPHLASPFGRRVSLDMGEKDTRKKRPASFTVSSGGGRQAVKGGRLVYKPVSNLGQPAKILVRPDVRNRNQDARGKRLSQFTTLDFLGRPARRPAQEKKMFFFLCQVNSLCNFWKIYAFFQSLEPLTPI